MGYLTTHDYILLGIRLLPNSSLGYDDREELGRSLGFSFLTVRRSLTDLKKNDCIIKEKEGTKAYFKITDEGMKKAEELYSDISNLYFTPQRHGVPTSIRLTEVLKLINDPFFKPFLVKLYFEKDIFDLMDTLKTFEMLKKETSIYNLFEKIDIFHGSQGMPNFTHSFIKATMFGLNENRKWTKENPSEGNIQVLLLDADLKARRGDLEEALSLYRTILQKPNLPQELWFIGILGLVKTYGRLGRRNEWEKALEETRRQTDNKIIHGYLNQIEADLLATIGDYDRAKILFEKAIGTFRHYNLPLFLSITYNNYGILMFNREMYDEAERIWKKGKRYGSESGNRFSTVPTDINLASIIRIKGDLEKARKYLEDAKDLCISQNNIEMLSSVEYNISLIMISEGNFEEAIELFNRSCFDTYPLLSEDYREERLAVFKREVEKYKYTPLRRGPKYDLVYMG
ncbi:MAG: tetratricopeptide repeat protein [Thermoplasmatota archaeon]